jgi:hypothetical protein
MSSDILATVTHSGTQLQLFQPSPDLGSPHEMRNERAAVTSVKRKKRSLMSKKQNILSQGCLSTYDTQSLY